MRVLVCGGRDFRDKRAVADALNAVGPDVIIQGGANGADAIAREYATVAEIGCETYAATWATYGRAAGPIRNQRMLDEGKPDLVIAFPGGRGTADMVRRAKAAGIRVVTPVQAAKGTG